MRFNAQKYVMSLLERIRIDDHRPEKKYAEAHLKRDGYCIVSLKDMESNFYCYTRTPRLQVSEQKWYKDLEKSLLPGEVVLGELFVQGGTSSHVRSVLCEKPRFEGHFEAFYTPCVDSFEDFKSWCDNRNLPSIQFAENLETVPPGYEGFVLKRTYHPNTAYSWMRKKGVMTIDLEVVGVEWPSEGRHFETGRIKSVICATADKKLVVNVGVMSDKVRQEITDDPTHWRGRIIEVRYEKRTSKGSLRHPRFVRVRDDKSTANQLPSDL